MRAARALRACPVLRASALACLMLGCQTREPASPKAEPAPVQAEAEAPAASHAPKTAPAEAEGDPQGKLAASDLVRVELGRVPDAAREALGARLGPASALAGTSHLVAVHHHLEPGWHIYWQNPGESGLRTRIDGEATGARLGEVLYPAPERLVAEGGQVSYGWGEDAVLFVPVRALDEAQAQLSLRTRYLVCRESCISGEATLAAKLDELPARSDPVTAAMLERVPEPAGERVAASWSDSSLNLRGAEGVELAELFPYASNDAMLDAQTRDQAGLQLRYRITGTPKDAAQGVIRATIAGAPRWLELAVPWPANPT